jgi:hypothetical protein
VSSQGCSPLQLSYQRGINAINLKGRGCIKAETPISFVWDLKWNDFKIRCSGIGTDSSALNQADKRSGSVQVVSV